MLSSLSASSLIMSSILPASMSSIWSKLRGTLSSASKPDHCITSSHGNQTVLWPQQAGWHASIQFAGGSWYARKIMHIAAASIQHVPLHAHTGAAWDRRVLCMEYVLQRWLQLQPLGHIHSRLMHPYLCTAWQQHIDSKLAPRLGLLTALCCTAQREELSAFTFEVPLRHSSIWVCFCNIVVVVLGFRFKAAVVLMATSQPQRSTYMPTAYSFRFHCTTRTRLSQGRCSQ